MSQEIVASLHQNDSIYILVFFLNLHVGSIWNRLVAFALVLASIARKSVESELEGPDMRSEMGILLSCNPRFKYHALIS